MTDDPDLRLQLFGADVLSDTELLSFFLTRGGAPGEFALRESRGVMALAGNLPGLLSLREGELCGVHGIGPTKARRILALAALAKRLAERPLVRGASCTDPRSVYEAFRGRLGRSKVESMWAVLVDSRMRKLAEVEVGRGGPTSVSVSAREVFEPAVREGASGLVLVHNHPSGDPQPSPSDVVLTERLAAAGETLGIAVLDHLVVGDGSFVSLVEEGSYSPNPVGFTPIVAA